jgi:hypothetical protein
VTVLLEREAELAALDGALFTAAAPLRGEDGSYRLENVFRFAVTRVR